MAERSRNFVVRKHSPVRRRILLISVTLIGVLALYIVYELGRYDAGFDRLSVSQQRSELEVRIDQLEKANRSLRTRLAELDTIRIGRNQERAELARTIGELQAQIARQAQELAFYRGIVTQGASTTIGVKIPQLRIAPGTQPNQFRVRLTIAQSVRPDEAITGSMSLKVEGESKGSQATLDLAALTRGKLKEQPFNFRYFENFDQEIVLPEGFRPEKLTVEVRSNRQGVTPLTQTFLWRVDAL